MKGNKIFLFVVLFFITKSVTAQINLPSDSIKILLCHKWGFKAIIMGGQRITNMNESVTYEFLTDGTLKRISSSGKSENGTWNYKSEQKIILLKIKKTVLYIPSLTISELIVSPGDGIDETKNGLDMGTVLKLLESN
jgi:hypothetical protein